MSQDDFEIPLFDLPVETEPFCPVERTAQPPSIASSIINQQTDILSDCLTKMGEQTTAENRLDFLAQAFNIRNRAIIKQLVVYYLEVLKDKASLLTFLQKENISDLLLMDEVFEEYYQQKPDDPSPRRAQALKIIDECRVAFFNKALNREGRNNLFVALLKSRPLTATEKNYCIKTAREIGNITALQLLVPKDKLYYLRGLKDAASIEKAIFTAYANVGYSKQVDEFLQEYLANQRDISQEEAARIVLVVAIRNRNEDLVDFVLKKRPLPLKKTMAYAELACSYGNIAIVERLTGNKLYYFQQQTTPEQLGQAVALAYRYSDMQQVDKCLKQYISYLHKSSKLPQATVASMKKEIFKQRKNFLSWGPLIASYLTQRDLNRLASYAPGTTISIDTDIALGLSKFQTVDELVKQLQQAAVKPDKSLPAIPLPEEYETLYPLPDGYADNHQGFYSMRTILRIFSEAQYVRATARKDDDADLYHSPRIKNSITTPFSAPRYDQVTPFVEIMYQLAGDKTSEWLRQNPHNKSYSLLYVDNRDSQSVAMTHVIQESENLFHLEKVHRHGLLDISVVWPRIETLGAEILHMDASKIVKDSAHCQQFYDRVIEFIWLMGNTTPMRRGTGCYVEQFLAFFHRFHGLPLPKIKRGLQLDCLNLTFDLPNYKYIFLSFFELHSLQPFVAHCHAERYQQDPEMRKAFATFRRQPPRPIAKISYPSKSRDTELTLKKRKLMSDHKKEFTQPTVTTPSPSTMPALLAIEELDKNFIPMPARADQVLEKKAETARLALVRETDPEIAAFYTACAELLENAAPEDCEHLAPIIGEGDQEKQAVAAKFSHIKERPHYFLHHGIETNNPYLFFFAYIIGADVNCIDINQRTPLVKLTCKPRSKGAPHNESIAHCVNFFLLANANPFLLDKFSNSPLIYAALLGHRTAVQSLLHASVALLNHKNISGDTALICAVTCGDPDIVRMLLAEPSLTPFDGTNEKGFTALDLAVSKNAYEIVASMIQMLGIQNIMHGICQNITIPGDPVINQHAKATIEYVLKIISSADQAAAINCLSPTDICKIIALQQLLVNLRKDQMNGSR